MGKISDILRDTMLRVSILAVTFVVCTVAHATTDETSLLGIRGRVGQTSTNKTDGSMTVWCDPTQSPDHCVGQEPSYSNSSCLRPPFSITNPHRAIACAVNEAVYQDGDACGQPGSAVVQVVSNGAQLEFDCMESVFEVITSMKDNGFPITYSPIACPS